MSNSMGWSDFCNNLKWNDVPSELKKILPKATAYFKRPIISAGLMYFIFNMDHLVEQPKDKEGKRKPEMEYYAELATR